MIQLVQLDSWDSYIRDKEKLEGSYWGYIDQLDGNYLHTPLSVSAILWAAAKGISEGRQICFYHPLTRRI